MAICSIRALQLGEGGRGGVMLLALAARQAGYQSCIPAASSYKGLVLAAMAHCTSQRSKCQPAEISRNTNQE